jgi:hypothetical protein
LTRLDRDNAAKVFRFAKTFAWKSATGGFWYQIRINAEGIFRSLDDHFSEEGHERIVTEALGDNKEPFMLLGLANQYLASITTVKLNPISIKFKK